MPETSRPLLVLYLFPNEETEQLSRDLSANYELIQGVEISDGREPAVALFRFINEKDKFFGRVKQFRETYPNVAIGILQPESLEIPLGELLQYSVFNILPLQLALQNRAHQLSRLLYSLLYPGWAFGIEHLLTKETAPTRYLIKTRDDKNCVQEEIEELLLSSRFDLSSINHVLVGLEETLNNGLFHAFRTEDGGEKYHLDPFTTLDETDQVTIEFALIGPRFIFSVTDNAGNLRLEKLLDRLTISDDPAKLLDERGRGLYIIRSLGTETVYNLWEGRMTQIIMTIDSPPILSRSKPLLINQYRDPIPAS